jgi:CheY-like chemotaxis protein
MMIPHPKGTILLVEDNVSFQQNLAVVFRSAGYETLVAASAEEGFAVLTNYKIHLIVLDYRLPDMNGMQFFDRLLSDDNHMDWRFIPVVTMTGYPISDEEKELFMRKGAKAFLTKMTGFSDLKKIVDREVEAYKAVINFEHEAAAFHCRITSPISKSRSSFAHLLKIPYLLKKTSRASLVSPAPPSREKSTSTSCGCGKTNFGTSWRELGVSLLSAFTHSSEFNHLTLI